MQMFLHFIGGGGTRGHGAEYRPVAGTRAFSIGASRVSMVVTRSHWLTSSQWHPSVADAASVGVEAWRIPDDALQTASWRLSTARFSTCLKRFSDAAARREPRPPRFQTASSPSQTIGVGVKPMKMKPSVSQPSAIRNQPRGTLSSAVGGCRGPIISNRKTISPYE